MTDFSQRMVWIDLEMTGLNPETDEIIEIASIVTDQELNIIAEGPELVIHQPAERFNLMDEWNRKQHTASGLWQKVITSEISIDQAEAMTLKFFKEHVAEKAVLCGNSIWQDRRFIRKYMPQIDAFLHYRMIDVSTIKELFTRWYPHTAGFKKTESHRALDDIIESIKELQFYRKEIFR